MLFVVGEHTALSSALSVVLRLFDVVSDEAHERMEVCSCNIDTNAVLKLIALQVWHAGGIHKLRCNAQVEVLAVSTFE